MELTIIHGQAHRENTFHVDAMLREKLEGSCTKVNEYFLPKDGPDFCVGCFQCIEKGEENCPQVEKTQEILRSILRSRIVIIDSPTYCLEMTGQLKTLFDHLAFLWMPHRPRQEMFSKIGIAVSTSAGAGAGGVTKSIARQMRWWGVPAVYRLHFAVKAARWTDVSRSVQETIARQVKKTAEKVLKRQKASSIRNFFLFHLIRRMLGSSMSASVDREYWAAKGWLGKTRPW